jgi:hypothetical protein
VTSRSRVHRQAASVIIASSRSAATKKAAAAFVKNASTTEIPARAPIQGRRSASA